MGTVQQADGGQDCPRYAGGRWRDRWTLRRPPFGLTSASHVSSSRGPRFAGTCCEGYFLWEDGGGFLGAREAPRLPLGEILGFGEERVVRFFVSAEPAD